MHSSKIRTLIPTATLAVAAALALGNADPAGAEPKKEPKAKGCPVEDEHGNVTYVEVGTRIGIFVCGANGEWKFGWLITEHVAPSKPDGDDRTAGARGTAGSLRTAP